MHNTAVCSSASFASREALNVPSQSLAMLVNLMLSPLAGYDVPRCQRHPVHNVLSSGRSEPPESGGGDAHWCVNDSASLNSQVATLTKGMELVLVGTAQATMPTPASIKHLAVWLRTLHGTSNAAFDSAF